jgi:hypothetical protein
MSSDWTPQQSTEFTPLNRLPTILAVYPVKLSPIVSAWKAADICRTHREG